MLYSIALPISVLSFTVFLAVFIFFNDRKSIANKLFGLQILSASFWILSNFMADISNDPMALLVWTKIALIGPTLIALFGYFFSLYFPKEKPTRAIYKYIVLVLGLLIIGFSFTSLNVESVYRTNSGFVVNAGMLYIPFLFYFSLTVYFSVSNMFRRAESYLEKTQVRFVVAGMLLSIVCGLLTNAILPVLGNSRYVSFGSYFIIFFLLFTLYAILKHHLFDIKVIATELLSFALSITLFVKILFSDNFQDIIVNICIFAAVTLFGIFLIKGVIKEVKQREQIEKMAEDVGRAYEAEKIAKERIEAARVQDEALLSSIGDGVIAVDRAGKIMFINSAAEQMLQIKAENVINKPYEEVLRVENEKGEAVPKEKSRLYEALTQGKKIVIGTNSSPALVQYYVKANKGRFPVSVTISPVILQGKIMGAVDVFRDITVERQIDKSKSEFVSLVSHQLRTPLSAIKWYSEMLLEPKGKKLLPAQKKYIDEIHRGNERMIKLIDIMLNVSRIEAGKIKSNPVKIDIKKTIEDIVAEQKFTIKNKQQKFILLQAEGLPEISIDTNLMRMVFQNIISNAVKYTPVGGRITCDITKKDNYILFEISDTGIGIPEEQQKRVFEKLFRASNAAPHDPEGNGLGLYLAKESVENLGGKISFKSKEGEGTTFFITLPIV